MTSQTTVKTGDAVPIAGVVIVMLTALLCGGGVLVARESVTKNELAEKGRRQFIIFGITILFAAFLIQLNQVERKGCMKQKENL